MASEVLTQAEIDALLNQINNGEVDAKEYEKSDEKKVKDYDFARPSKFSKEHLRTLEIIFEHYGRLLATNLPAYLRKNVHIEVMNAEAVTYSEFTSSLLNPVLLGVINFMPLEGSVIIELADNLGYAIVDRMLGGHGLPLEKSREFSEIELIIIERIFQVFINLLKEPWENVLDINPKLERIETNSQFAQIISPSEMTSIVTMKMKIGEVEGVIKICLPYACLEEIIDKLNTKYWYSTMQIKDDKLYQEIIEITLSKVKVPLKAILGKSTLSVNDFINIQKGDIIRLSTKIDDELDIYVGNIKKFQALPGASSDSYAVRVTSIIREEQ